MSRMMERGFGLSQKAIHHLTAKISTPLDRIGRTWKVSMRRMRSLVRVVYSVMGLVWIRGVGWGGSGGTGVMTGLGKHEVRDW